MQPRRPPLGAMLVGLTALLAGWSMAALAGTGADREAGSDAPAADVPMVVAPPGGSNPQDAPPSRPPSTTTAPPRPKPTTTTAPPRPKPSTTTAPARSAKPPVRSAPAPASSPRPPAPPAPPTAVPAAPPAPPTAVPAAPPAPPTTTPPTTAPPTTVPAPSPAPEPPPARPSCNVPRNQPPWAEQADLLHLVEATHDVIDEVGSAGFAGFVVTPEKCRLDLYWVGAPPPEVDEVVRHDRRVVVHADAPYDHAELSRAAEALVPGSPLGRSSGVEITSVAVPPEGTGLRVGVEPAGAGSTCGRPRRG